MKSPLFLFLFLPIAAYSAPSASFDGCKGLTVTRARDFSQVDVSADLKKAEKRISDLCANVIPKKWKAIDASAQSCVAGGAKETSPGVAGEMKAKMQSQMASFDKRIKEACDSMKKTMEESKRACGVRKSTLDQLNKSIATIEKAQSDQTGSQKNVAALYGGAVSAYGSTAKSAGAAKEKIYATLPDKDENRRQQMRSGHEAASTNDFKTDQLIADWKNTLTQLAKDNKKKAACVKLAAKGGQLDEMGGILKKNLWPNGKLAARAMARIESADKEKAAEFAQQQAEAVKRADGAKVAAETPAEKPAQQTAQERPAEAAPTAAYTAAGDYTGMGEPAANLQQEAVDACQKKGGCQTGGAVVSAIQQVESRESAAASVTPTAAYTAAGDYTGMGDPVNAGDENRAPASTPTTTNQAFHEVCFNSVWQWWPPGYTKVIGVKNSAGKCVIN